MKKKRFTEQQIAFALRQAEQGTAVEEITRKLGVSEATFYRWKKKFSGMGVAELRSQAIAGAQRRPPAPVGAQPRHLHPRMARIELAQLLPGRLVAAVVDDEAAQP